MKPFVQQHCACPALATALLLPRTCSMYSPGWLKVALIELRPSGASRGTCTVAVSDPSESPARSKATEPGPRYLDQYSVTCRFPVSDVQTGISTATPTFAFTGPPLTPRGPLPSAPPAWSRITGGTTPLAG